jgi:hypothetical protein
MEQSKRKTGVLLALVVGAVALGLWYASARAAPPEGQISPRAEAGQSSPPAKAGSSPNETEEGAKAARQEADAFAHEALEALRAAGLRGELRYDPERFLITIPELEGQHGQTIFLGNFLDEYRARPRGERFEALLRLVRFSAAPPKGPGTYAEARPVLVPVVRPRVYFDMLSLTELARPSDGGVKGGEVPVTWEPLGGVLGLALVVDTPDAMRFVGPADLAQWGVSFKQALADAMENLRRRSREDLAALAPGTCRGVWDDSYGSSRLLLDEVLRRCPVRGEPVVLVPNRDLLIVTGSKDDAGLLQAAELAMVAYEVPRPVDGRALRRTPQGWVPFLPPKGSKAWLAFRKLLVESQRREYAAQGEQLDQKHEQEGVDIFVDKVIPDEDARGNVFSQAVWVRGIDTLLPRVDRVICMDSDLDPKAPPVAEVRWEVVERDVGALLAPVEGLYPVRYRLKGFPSAEQLARWKKDPSVLDMP